MHINDRNLCNRGQFIIFLFSDRLLVTLRFK